MNPRYQELLLPYKKLRTANLHRRAQLWFRAYDPFYFATPCWQKGRL